MTSMMEFDCKLAHCDEIKRISNFNSIKELYERVSQLFDVSTSDILYCTLNTHNFRDMSALLGNYLSLGDKIIVHLCGSVKELTIRKTHEFLGLTITDNAAGRAFIKRVKSNDKNVDDHIKPGDHIAAINSESTVGMRHYEVAKVIRLLPQNSNFTIRLIEPKYSERYMRASMLERENLSFMNNSSGNNNNNSNNSINRHELSGAISLGSTCDELINSSLPIDKLLSRSNRLTHYDDNKMPNRPFDLLGDHHQQDGYKFTIDKINTYLESFLGINDTLLAIRIYRLARENKDSYSSFEKAIANSELQVFNFDQDMKDHLWKCAIDLSM